MRVDPKLWNISSSSRGLFESPPIPTARYERRRGLYRTRCTCRSSVFVIFSSKTDLLHNIQCRLPNTHTRAHMCTHAHAYTHTHKHTHTHPHTHKHFNIFCIYQPFILLFHNALHLDPSLFLYLSSSFVRQLSYFQAGRCQPGPAVLVQVGQAPLSIRWPVHCAVVHDVLHRLVWRTTFAFRGRF